MDRVFYVFVIAVSAFYTVTCQPFPPGGVDIVNPTFPTPATPPPPSPPAPPRCDIMKSVACLRSVSQARQALVNQQQEDATDSVDRLCRSMESSFICIGDGMEGCTGKYRLLYDTAVAAGRYLCNGAGRQGFVDNYQCLFSEKFKNSSNGSCSTNVVTGIVDYVMQTSSSSSDPEEVCSLGRNVTSCIMKTAWTACGTQSVSFLKDYLTAAMAPLRQMVACDQLTSLTDLVQANPPTTMPPTTTTTMPPTTTTTMPPTTTTTMPPTTTRPTTTAPPTTGQPITLPVARRSCNQCSANRRRILPSLVNSYDLFCSTNFIQSGMTYCPRSVCTRRCTLIPVNRLVCYAVGPLRDLDESDAWCQRMCPRGQCPLSVSSLCRCRVIPQTTTIFRPQL